MFGYLVDGFGGYYVFVYLYLGWLLLVGLVWVIVVVCLSLGFVGTIYCFKLC